MSIIEFMLLGVLAGTVSGLLGIGGGVILVPGLIFIFGLSQHMAQGTSLALMVPPIGFLAAWTYYKKGHVDLRVAGVMCLGFAAGGWLGAVLATVLSNAVLGKVFGIALLLVACKMLMSKEHQVDEEPQSGWHYNLSVKRALLFLALGIGAGVLSGLIGIGAGILAVPILILFFGMSQHQAQGTTLAVMVPPIGLLAAWQYYRAGNVDVHVAILVCIGFFAGGFLGARLANKLPSRVLSRAFGILMLLLAAKMLVPL